MQYTKLVCIHQSLKTVYIYVTQIILRYKMYHHLRQFPSALFKSILSLQSYNKHLMFLQQGLFSWVIKVHTFRIVQHVLFQISQISVLFLILIKNVASIDILCSWLLTSFQLFAYARFFSPMDTEVACHIELLQIQPHGFILF